MKRDDIPELVSDETLRDELFDWLEKGTEAPSELLMLCPAPGMQKDALLLNFEQNFRKALAQAIDLNDGPSHEKLGRLISERALWAWEECR